VRVLTVSVVLVKIQFNFRQRWLITKSVATAADKVKENQLEMEVKSQSQKRR
jgi:hypothetical protein